MPMNIPRDFFYANKVEEFVSLMQRQRIDDIIEIMCDRAQESGVSCGESEIESWKCNFEAIHKLLLKSEVAGDGVIRMFLSTIVAIHSAPILFWMALGRLGMKLRRRLKLMNTSAIWKTMFMLLKTEKSSCMVSLFAIIINPIMKMQFYAATLMIM